MSNHPNRSRRKHAPGRVPTPAEIAQLREDMELTQTEAGRLVYASLRSWQDWEYGKRRMHPAIWEYLCLLNGFPEVQLARAVWLEEPGAIDRWMKR